MAQVRIVKQESMEQLSTTQLNLDQPRQHPCTETWCVRKIWMPVRSAPKHWWWFFIFFQGARGLPCDRVHVQVHGDRLHGQSGRAHLLTTPQQIKGTRVCIWHSCVAEEITTGKLPLAWQRFGREATAGQHRLAWQRFAEGCGATVSSTQRPYPVLDCSCWRHRPHGMPPSVQLLNRGEAWLFCDRGYNGIGGCLFCGRG